MKSNGGSSFDNLALEFVRVTEVAAIAAAKWIGKGEAKLADKAAVDAMRAQFNTIDFLGEIVIGEGAKVELLAACLISPTRMTWSPPS